MINFHHSNAVYFNIEEGKERCFVEEVPPEVLVLANYQSPDTQWKPIPPHMRASLDHIPEHSGIRIQVMNPNKDIIHSSMADSEGRFAFTSHIGGEHRICLSTNTTHWFGTPRKFRFHLRIDIGESAINYNEIAKKEHLSAIEIELRKLNDKVRQIKGEQGYQRSREEEFRNTSESTNTRVMYWSIIQTFILLLSGFYQLYHLKKFFKQKKLN